MLADATPRLGSGETDGGHIHLSGDPEDRHPGLRRFRADRRLRLRRGLRDRALPRHQLCVAAAYPFEIVLIAGKIAKLKSANGPSVMPDLDFAQALAQPLDLLIVPGGAGTWPLL